MKGYNVPRSGDEYSLPAGTAAVSGATANSTHVNSRFSDLEAEQNLARPVTKGGTGATSAAAALVNLGVTATAAELNILDGATVTVTELNVLDGIPATLTATELGYVDGVTSAIQTQLNAKQASSATLTSIAASGVTTTEIAAATLVTAADTIASNDNDTTIPTSAAVIDYVGANSPIKAWANFHATPTAGTYTRSGTTITVTMTSHGMTTGQGVLLDFTSGTATDGYYTITVTDANTFTVTDAASGATSGNVNRNIWVRASGNIASAAYNGSGDYTFTFSTAMSDANYAVTTSAENVLNRASLALSVNRSTAPTTTALRLSHGPTGADGAPAATENTLRAGFAVIR
jgi:hypothetical protein